MSVRQPCRELRDLLRALKDTSASSSALLSGVSRTSRDQNRREAHACQENGTPDEADGQSARPSAAARPVRRRSPQDNSGYASMAGTAGETRATLTGLMARLILEH